MYDTANRLTSQSWVIGNDAFSESYTYNDPGNTSAPLNNGSLATMTTATGDQQVYNYDELRRPSTVHTKNSSGTPLFHTARNYETISGDRSSNLISAFAYYNSDDQIINYNTYSYDSVGNITAIYQHINGNSRPLASYEYDSQNQLTQEIRYSYSGSSLVGTATTINYDYDTAGNLLGSYNTNGVNWITYSYANDNWSDLLTSINVDGTTRTISYCGGNPTNWYNGNTYTNLTWTQGRRLSSLSKNGTNISYTYDMEGIRSSKTVDGTTHSYITQSGRVARETYGSNVLDFIYDTNGSPFALRYSDNNGTSFTTYYYILNTQGDVVDLINSSGTTVASYSYDAWGNILTAIGSMASINPLRYRGYYYDIETGWYYLQSRYYDSEIGRFINADSYASTGQGFLGCNMFAYCNNNSINFSDPEGKCYRNSQGVWQHEYWEYTSGYHRQPDPKNVGAAKPYKEIGASDGKRENNPNCYSYALGYYDKSYNPGELSGVKFNTTVQSVADAVMKDMSALGRKCRPLYACDFSVSDNEYRVALRVSPVYEIIYDGSVKYSWDYHFMIQTNTGGWAEKHGPGGSTVYHPSGTPDTLSWDCANIKGYYQSSIQYFAFTY